LEYNTDSLLVSSIEIYRIVSNKALESSGDVIRPTGGETINVTPTSGDANAAGKCC
jgi:Ras-related protein Rab-11A